MKDVVAGNNRFAVELYRAIAPGSGNRFVSPSSLSTALAMTLGGARGATAAEMVRTLHLPSAEPAVHAAIAELTANLRGAVRNGTLRAAGPRPPYQLDVANALWGQADASFVPAYLALLKSEYEATVHPVDFQRDPAAALRTINAWVEEQTQGKIRDLLGSGDVTPATELVLTNAIYFKGRWTTPFEKGATADRPFRAPGSDPIAVPTMHRKGRIAHFQGDGFQAIELPYEGDTLSMLVILPAADDGVPAVEAALNFDWVDRLRPQQVELALPRFQAESRVELAKTLAELGMPRAFSPEADFSGISTEARLQLSNVIHKAFVDVNEEGTEAAAATAVVAVRASAIAPQPVTFRADHPFLFAIRHRPTGAILFLGRIVDPRN